MTLPSPVYRLTCVLMFLAVAASATTIILPTDEQLIDQTPLIVEGTVVSSVPIDRNGTIWTESTLAVDRTLKGSAAGTLTIREIGGMIGDRITKVFGAPEYADGDRVLAFLTPTPRGDYQTVDLYVGTFREQRTLDGTRVWERDDAGAPVVLLDSAFRPILARNVQRNAAEFEQFILDHLAGRPALKNYGMENPALQRDFAPDRSGRITANFTLLSEPTIYRWFAFENGSSANWYSSGTQPGYSGGGVSEVQTAMNVWDGYSAALIRYTYAGAETRAPGGLSGQNGVNEILFNDPLQEIAGTFSGSGVVGEGGFNGVTSGGNWTSTFTADATHTQGTFHAYDIVEANLTIQDGVSPSSGVSSSVLAEICAHELGHTLGFGHSSDPTALMYPSVTPGGPTLRPDDQLAARWLYPNGGSTAPPPPPAATAPAAPSSLGASVSGPNIVLQWRDNATNETGQWIYFAPSGSSFARLGDAGAGATSATITGASAGAYRIYITAYNSAGESAASNIATVTLGGSTTQPAPAPVAAFAVSPSVGTAGQTTFAFTDQSSGGITARLWNFGDGTTSGAVNPTHVYTSAGIYTVALTVTGSGGTAQAAHGVTVNAAAPAAPAVQAAFDLSPSPANAGDSISFFDRSSGSPSAWSWQFGDGATSNAQNPVHAFTLPGTYTVTLTVFNAVSSSAFSRPVTVNPLAPARSLVSVTAQTDGAGGSVWRTELTIFNAGNEAASGQFVFVPGAGGSVQTRPLYLAPRQSLTFGNALLDIFGMPSGAGAVSIEATSPSSTPNLKVTSRTFTTGSSGTYGQGVPNVDPADLQQTLFLTGLESDTDFRTNIGLVNRSDSAVSIALQLLDSIGGVVGNGSVSVPPDTFEQTPLTALFPAAAGRGYGALSMRAIAAAPNAISVYASVVDNHTQDPIYLQAGSLPGGSRAVIPAVGRAAGANGTFWRSDVRLFNPNATTIGVTLHYLPAGSDDRNAQTLPVSILPNQTVVLTDVLSRFSIASGSGAMELTWSGAAAPVIASRTYTPGNGGTYGQAIEPVRSFASDADIPGLRSDGAFRSNVGFVNGGDAAMPVQTTLLSSSGQTIASAIVQLAPKSQVQISLAALFPGVDVASLGSVTLHAHTDSGPQLFAYGSVVDNRSGDPVFYGGM